LRERFGVRQQGLSGLLGSGGSPWVGRVSLPCVKASGNRLPLGIGKRDSLTVAGTAGNKAILGGGLPYASVALSPAMRLARPVARYDTCARARMVLTVV
jgi:hypothetical protein